MKTSLMIFVALSLVLGSVLAAKPETITAKVVGVSDGDTLTVVDEAKQRTKTATSAE